jgi:hypothetical protein
LGRWAGLFSFIGYPLLLSSWLYDTTALAVL